MRFRRRVVGALLSALVSVAAPACGMSGDSSDDADRRPSSTADRQRRSASSDASTTSTSRPPSPTPATGPSTSSGTTAPAPPAGGVAVEQWASSFCGVFGTWFTDMRAVTAEASRSLQEATTPSASRQVLLDTYLRAGGVTDTLVTAVGGLGPPAIARGAFLKRDLLARFQRFGQELRRLTDQVRAADPADQATFAATVRSAGEAFQANVAIIGTSFGEIDAAYPDPRFQAALRSSCAFLGA